MVFALLLLFQYISVLGLPNGLGLKPPLGYSSWNDCASEVTEERIKNITKALISTGLAAKGYIHVNVDEGWFKNRTAQGIMVEDPIKFPSGMKALGNWIHNQEVHGLGKIMKYGLYTSRGTRQCSTKKYHGPGSHGHISADAQWMVDAGMDYLKEDSCGGSQNHTIAFSDYAGMRDALNKTGRPVYFSLCGWGSWYAPKGYELGNSWRIAGDGQNWGALSNCINTNVNLGQYARPGAWNDPDLLIGTGVGSGDKKTNPSACYDQKEIPQSSGWYQTDNQSRAQFSMWCVMSSPLLISANIWEVSSYAIETWSNEEAIYVNQNFRKGGPYQGFRIAGGDISYSKSSNTGSGFNVWAKPLPNNVWAMCFLNNDSKEQNVICDASCFAKLNLTVNTYIVRDLWKHKDVGNITGPSFSYSVTLPAVGGVALFKLTPNDLI